MTINSNNYKAGHVRNYLSSFTRNRRASTTQNSMSIDATRTVISAQLKLPGEL